MGNRKYLKNFPEYLKDIYLKLNKQSKFWEKEMQLNLFMKCWWLKFTTEEANIGKWIENIWSLKEQ